MATATTTADGQEEQNFWPGYVDTLVNMVMFLILLIVILSMAVIFFSARARFDAMKSQTGIETPEPVLPTPDPLLFPREKESLPGTQDRQPKRPTIEDLLKQVDELKQKLFLAEQKYKPVLNPPQAKEEREVKDAKGVQTLEGTQDKPTVEGRGVQEFSLRPTSVLVRFRPGALDLSADEAARLSDIFTRHFDFAPDKGQRFLLTAEAAEGLSESARMAYYRVAAVRNRLMGVTGVPRDRLMQRIQSVPTADVKGTEALEVRITLVPATTEAAASR
ncbi:vesicle formation protein [Leptothrix discophora]|uniref:Vesicle formation protein n=1 Tax=Leptothrix discophora TaxID=89 RepID=A0ABT9G3J1_LEPDI|nr:vesicle formation protein [Leptothrix discophora]MDP4300990.1 vesicle formation protein [Leptothrix discophora]